MHAVLGICRQPKLPSILCLLFSLISVETSTASQDIVFDMAPTAEAVSVVSAERQSSFIETTDEKLVNVILQLSSMSSSTESRTVDQWLVKIQPRQPIMQIADYSPRTEIASQIDGPIQVKTTHEKSTSFGLSADGRYGNLAHANTGADSGKKSIRSQQYNRVAPIYAVTASGTINRGRGVYFKLKWTEQQVLDGEKLFTLTFAVPHSWRCGLLDVSVEAQRERKVFPGFERETITVTHDHFVVAVYESSDVEARQRAEAMVQAEEAMRAANSAEQHRKAVPALLKGVGDFFDFSSGDPQETGWAERVVIGVATPHDGEELLSLPVQTRVVALDYCEARDEFIALNGKKNRNIEMVDSSRPQSKTTRPYTAGKAPIQ